MKSLSVSKVLLGICGPQTGALNPDSETLLMIRPGGYLKLTAIGKHTCHQTDEDG